MIGDALIVVIRSLAPPSVASVLSGIGVGDSLKVKPPDIAAFEVGRKGFGPLCTRRSARLAAKCHGGTFVLPVPRRRLPGRVVSRQRFICPRSCSYHPLRGGTSSSHCCLASPAPPGRVGCRE
jgi:hypothetical protein